ncbi:MAG: hypothetical protein LBT05_14150 [Planctomycetaceae bacterium]|jgi:hypothetical protein|nr:hypothetical protein [Planctomycetaceae bacterium]
MERQGGGVKTEKRFAKETSANESKPAGERRIVCGDARPMKEVYTETKISLFKCCKSPNPTGTIRLQELFDGIKDGRWKEEIESFRVELPLTFVGLIRFAGQLFRSPNETFRSPLKIHLPPARLHLYPAQVYRF